MGKNPARYDYDDALSNLQLLVHKHTFTDGVKWHSLQQCNGLFRLLQFVTPEDAASGAKARLLYRALQLVVDLELKKEGKDQDKYVLAGGDVLALTLKLWPPDELQSITEGKKLGTKAARQMLAGHRLGKSGETFRKQLDVSKPISATNPTYETLCLAAFLRRMEELASNPAAVALLQQEARTLLTTTTQEASAEVKETAQSPAVHHSPEEAHSQETRTQVENETPSASSEPPRQVPATPTSGAHEKKATKVANGAMRRARSAYGRKVARRKRRIVITTVVLAIGAAISTIAVLTNDNDSQSPCAASNLPSLFMGPDPALATGQLAAEGGREPTFSVSFSNSSSDKEASLPFMALTDKLTQLPCYMFLVDMALEINPSNTCQGPLIEWSVPSTGDWAPQAGMFSTQNRYASLTVPPAPGSAIRRLAIHAKVVGKCASPMKVVVRNPRLVPSDSL